MKTVYLIFVIIILYGCSANYLNESPITIKAHFMKYACGDWVDDMQVLTVSDTTYNYIIENDIDPIIINGEDEIGGFLWYNETEKFGSTYILKGYLDSKPKFGCENSTPKFWAEEITKVDGSKFELIEK